MLFCISCHKWTMAAMTTKSTLKMHLCCFFMPCYAVSYKRVDHFIIHVMKCSGYVERPLSLTWIMSLVTFDSDLELRNIIFTPTYLCMTIGLYIKQYKRTANKGNMKGVQQKWRPTPLHSHCGDSPMPYDAVTRWC